MIKIITKLPNGIQYAVLLISLLAGCSVDKAPPLKEEKVIRNSVASIAAIGEVRSARLSAYEVTGDGDCEGLRLMDSQSLRSDGRFNLTLDIDKGMVLYKLRDATYIEEASQQEVAMTDDQWLGAVFFYDRNQPQQEVVLSPWSHLQTGLFCQEVKESSPIEALEEADEFIFAMLGFDPLYSGVRLATQAANNRLSVPFDEGMKLGFMNAALSQFSAKLSRQLEANEHLFINSVYIAQLFYQDIYTDGVLDGRGDRGRLHITGDDELYPITLATYKTQLPLALLEFYDDNDLNQITRGRGILYSMAAGMNGNQHPALFEEGMHHIPLDGDPPEASWLSERQLTGWVNISLRLEDLTSIDKETIRFYSLANEGSIESRTDGLFVVLINTKTDGSGLTNYQLFVKDTLGNSKTYEFPVELINDPPSIRVRSSDHSKEGEYDLVASYALASPNQQIEEGECIFNQEVFPLVIDSSIGEVRCSVSFSANGDNFVEVRLCDSYGHCSAITHQVVYDDQPPEIEAVYEQDLYQQNISLVFSVVDRTTGLDGQVSWKLSANGQSLSGNARFIDGNYSIRVDGARFGNNLVQLTLNATDRLGNFAVFSESYRVANKPATIGISSSPWIKDNFHRLVFTVDENSFTKVKADCLIDNRTGFVSSISYKAGVGECFFVLPQLEDGIYQATIRVCGDYGLCEVHSTRLIKDTKAPSISVSGLEETSMDGHFQTNISASDDYGRIVWLSYQLDEGAETQLTERLLTFDGLATGRHGLTIRARDEVGNLAQQTYEFLVLKDEPQLSLMSNGTTRANVYSFRAAIDAASYEGSYSSWCGLGTKRVPAHISNDLLTCDLDLTNLRDGEHSISIELVADHASYEREVLLVKDTSPPTIDMSSIDEYYHSGAIPLLIGIEDRHSSVTDATYRLDDGQAIPLTAQAPGWGFILAVDELATGRHRLRIVARDELGNQAIKTKEFLVLKDEPSLVRTSAFWSKDQSYVLRAALNSHSYEGNYEASCQLDLQSVVASIENGVLSCPLELTDLADGNWTINIDLMTDYGRSYPRKLKIVKDTSPPEIELINLAARYENGTLPLNIGIVDLHTGVKKASYRLDNSIEKPLTKRGGNEWGFILAVAELATGRHSISIRATDGAGNERLIAEPFLVLKDEPQLNLLSDRSIRENGYSLKAEIDSASYEGDYSGFCRLGAVRVPAQISSATRLLSCVLDLTNLQDGDHRVRIELLANYGIQYEREVVLVKDTSPPTIDMSSIAEVYNSGAIPLLIGIEDSHSSVASATYSLDGGQAIPLTAQAQGWGFILAVDSLATGRHSLSILARDELGNQATKTQNFLILKDEPSLTRTSPSHTKDQAYSLTAELDSHSYEGNYQGHCQLGSARVPALIGNGILACTLSLTNLADGNWTIRIDLMADYGRSYLRELNLVKDSVPPEIEFVNLAASYDNGTFPMNIRITDVHSGVKQALYRLNNNIEKPLTKQGGDEWSFILAVDELATGRHSISVRATDGTGNVRLKAAPFLVLKDEPQLRLLSDSNLREDGYSLEAEIDAASYEGGYSGWCRLGTKKVPAHISNGLLTCDLDLTNLRDGEHRVGIELIAEYDPPRYEREVLLLKDTSPPTIDMRLIADEYYSGAVPLLIGIVDSHLSVASATYSLDGGQAIPLTPQAQGWGFILAVDSLATGQHSLSIVAEDELGNQATKTREFLILKDEPALTRTSPLRTKHQAYSLTAELNSRSYQGSYQGHCQLGSRRVLALIEDSTLSCPLDLTNLVDGNWTIGIDLMADYGKSYSRELSLVIDRTPPQISAYNPSNLYTSSPVRLEFEVIDALSPVENLFYSYGDSISYQAARYLGNNYWTLDMQLATNGEHSLSLIARDVLGHEQQQDLQVLLVKDAPQLHFTHPSLSRETTMDISGNITLATPLAPVAHIDCLVPNDSAVRAIITADKFVCRSYDIEDYDENPIDVRVCDIHQICAVFQTYVSQDSRSPLVSEVFPDQLLSYDFACLGYSNYDNIPADCPIEMQSGILQSAGTLNPRPFILYQNATQLDERELAEQESMDAAGIAYVLITAADRSDPRFYFSRPQDLNISYSYTQLNCLVDDRLRCPTSRRTLYFADRPLEPWSYEDGEAKATIAFTNEFLNQAGKPLWYLAPTSYIHRLDISICDEARNCITRIVRFRIKLFASEPIVTAQVNDNFIRLLRQSSDYAQTLGSSTNVARQWEILNPSSYPIWVRLANPEDITIDYDKISIRKRTAYIKHEVREFVHSSYLPGDASCGRTPWYAGNKRRAKYRIYHQYLSGVWTHTYHEPPGGGRGGPYGTHRHQFKDRESCSRVTDRIIRTRYQVYSTAPRVITSDSPPDESYSFIHSLNYYSVNDRGELISAYPENGFYRIRARDRLIVQTNERLRGTPPHWTDREAIYERWKTLDNERTINIPFALDLSYLPSSFTDENRPQPATNSLRYAEQAAELAEQTFRRRLPLYCAGTCFQQRTNDSWEQINN